MTILVPTVLLSGFEPFGGARTNASQEVVRALEGSRVAGHRIVGVVLPCTFGAAPRRLARAIRKYRPALVVCLGEARTRQAITPERRAFNLDDARLPDNAGRQPRRVPVVRGGPVTRRTRLPVDAIVAALRQRGIPAAASSSAGRYVCNHVFYSLMHETARTSRPAVAARGTRVTRERPRAGFIHVPGLPASRRGSIPLRSMIAGIRRAIEVSLEGVER